jgi:ribosome biogenesis protein MAK21
MPKTKAAASGANAVTQQKHRKKLLNEPSAKSKIAEEEDLRKTIQRRYLQDSDVAQVPGEKTGGNEKFLKKGSIAKEPNVNTIERGKKRKHDGRVVQNNRRPPGEPEPDQAGEAGEEDILEREMKELGGTAEDRELLAGADSESELEGDVSPDAMKNLDKGMQNILKEIALAQGKADKVHNKRSEDSEDGRADTKSQIQKEDTPKEDIEENPKPLKKGQKAQTLFVCEPRPEWFDVPDLEIDTTTPASSSPSKDTVDKLHAYAKSLLDTENLQFQKSQQSSSAQSFYNTVITSGTLSDKISALTLAVQESPLHNIKALETLIGLASKRSRSQAVDVLRALKDLFAQGSLLPQSRKLYAFQSQPVLPFLFSKNRTWVQGQKLPKPLTQQHLVVWAFESWLKEQYFEILKILEVWCNDEIEFSKARAVSYVYELLKERPEQESNLLRLLVNKLGDPVKKIASQASYLLMQLLIAHPAMKMVVVSAVEADFIFRPGQSLHGKYYAVVTLNQTSFSVKEEDVAVKLLDIYFGLFTELLKTGKFAKPVEPATPADEDGHENKPRRRKMKKPPQVAPAQAQTEELREKLISAVLTGVNRAYPYTTSTDASNTAFSDHLDTLFKITHAANFNTSIQSLMLIQQISQASQHKASSDRFYRVLYESLLDYRLIIASKNQLYLNLLHRALKADLHVNRVKAFVKRLVQVLSLHEPSFICGAFFLIQDLIKTFPSLKSLIDEGEDHEDDDIEVFRDVPDEDDELPPTASTNGPKTEPNSHTYDAHKRDPLHANASAASLWDILPFLAHFHPSVSVSADNLLQHQPLSGKPDLTLHTLSHFLDRFVYRNPKLSQAGLLRGSSLMQPMATDNAHAVLLGADKNLASLAPVNSEAFRTKSVDAVAAEDVFFHRYFSAVKKTGPMSAKERKKAEKKKSKNIDDGEESEADEDEIWKVMMQSAPDLEGDEFDDDDESGFDAEDMESDDELAGGSDDADGDVDIDPAFFDDDDDEVDDDMPIQAGSDDEDAALLRADADAIPSDVDDFAGFDSDADEEEKKQPPTKKSKKAKDKAEKKRLKNLPTFASAEDYAKMLEDDEDEDR